jgi:hypothetical protein
VHLLVLIICESLQAVTIHPWFEIRSQICSVVRQTKLCLTELITELLGFERSILWCTGHRLKCHSGRYRSVGRIFARIALAVFLRRVERVVTAHS